MQVASLCVFEQIADAMSCTLGAMDIQHIKMAISALWVVAAVVIGIAIDLPWTGRVALAAVGSLPPLAMLLLWNDPAPTMSESIREARR